MKVVFRKFADGSVIALFPEEPWCRLTITSYMHVGQHGGACPSIVSITRPTTSEEYGPLFKELENMGYENLKVRKNLNIVWR